MAEYDNERRGVLFKNDKEGNENRPDYKGNCQINGEKFNMSAWLKKDKNGKTFMSFAFDPKEGGSAPRQQAAVVEDDVPF